MVHPGPYIHVINRLAVMTRQPPDLQTATACQLISEAALKDIANNKATSPQIKIDVCRHVQFRTQAIISRHLQADLVEVEIQNGF